MNNLLRRDDDLDFLNEESSEKNAVTRLFKSNDNTNITKQINTNLTLIPLELIRPRRINLKIVGDIETLANSIKETGLIYPIIVYPEDLNDNKKYTISAGHRRYAAYEMLYKNAVELNNKTQMELYKNIKARVLSKEELDQEEDIYKASNLSRDETIFEKVLNYNPHYDMFENIEIKKDYVRLKYGSNGWEDMANGKIKVKFNISDIKDYVAIMYHEDFKNDETTNRTIGDYVDIILKLSTDAIDAVLKAKITPRESRSIAKYSHKEQNEIIALVNNGINIGDATNEIIKPKDIIQADVELTDKDKVVKIGKTLIRCIDELNSVTSIKNKDFNGNEKEYQKQLKKILKQIEILNEMPIK